METVAKILGEKAIPPRWEGISPDNGIELSSLERAFVSVVSQKKRMVLLGALLLSAFVYGVSHLIPKSYVTQSLVTIVRSKPKVETVEIEKLPDTGESRIETLVGLAVSGDIITETLRQLEVEGVDLKKTQLTSDSLVHAMSPRLYGDMIGLTFRWRDPSLATLGANVWARVFVKHVNRTFSVGYTAENKESLEVDYQHALAEFRKANQMRADLEKNNSSRWIASQIEEKKKLVSALLDLRQHRVNEKISDTKKSLSSCYDQRLRLIERLDEARSLAEQIKSEKGRTVGSHLALVTLKAKVFSSETEGEKERFSPQITLDASFLASPSPSGYLSDLAEAEELSRTIEGRLGVVNERILSLSNMNAEGLGVKGLLKDDNTDRLVGGLQKEINDLERQKTIQESRNSEVENKQKIMASIYQLASARMQQMSSASTLEGNEVRLASLAYPPLKPSSPRPLRNAFSAFLLGGALFFLLAVIRQYNWGGRSPC